MDGEQFVAHVKACLDKAEANQSKLPPAILALQGCSGSKTKHFLNNLMSADGIRYLDVGTVEGSSVCAAVHGNTCETTVVDNSPSPVKELRDSNLATWGQGVTLIEKDSFRVNVTKELKKFNVYLYDGPDHSSLGHYRAIQHYFRALDDVFVLVIDDWNWPDVRSSTMNVLKGMRLNKLFEKEIYTNRNGEPQWWNGLYVAVLEKSKQL